MNPRIVLGAVLAVGGWPLWAASVVDGTLHAAVSSVQVPLVIPGVSGAVAGDLYRSDDGGAMWQLVHSASAAADGRLAPYAFAPVAEGSYGFRVVLRFADGRQVGSPPRRGEAPRDGDRLLIDRTPPVIETFLAERIGDAIRFDWLVRDTHPVRVQAQWRDTEGDWRDWGAPGGSASMAVFAPAPGAGAIRISASDAAGNRCHSDERPVPAPVPRRLPVLSDDPIPVRVPELVPAPAPEAVGPAEEPAAPEIRLPSLDELRARRRQAETEAAARQQAADAQRASAAAAVPPPPTPSAAHQDVVVPPAPPLAPTAAAAPRILEPPPLDVEMASRRVAGDPAEALHLYEMAAPRLIDEAAHLEAVRALLALRRPRDAYPVLARVAPDSPRHREASWLAVQVMEADRRRDAATALARQMLARNPDDAWARQARAYLNAQR